MSDLRLQLLATFRSVMPGAAGVVLASSSGHPVAHDLSGNADPYALARHARTLPPDGAGTLVPHAGSVYLVVALPDAVALSLAPAGAVA